MCSSDLSTNAEAMRMLKTTKPKEGTCIVAKFQHTGKGQRTNQWYSNAGENVLCSFILYPPAHAANQPFMLSKAVALAAHTTIQHFTKQAVEIKWPNDIFVAEKKIAGILIENQWIGSNWNAAVAGIGINVNQREFGTSHATSLALENN